MTIANLYDTGEDIRKPRPLRGLVARLVRLHQRSVDHGHLAAQPDYVLRDVGLTRADVEGMRPSLAELWKPNAIR